MAAFLFVTLMFATPQLAFADEDFEDETPTAEEVEVPVESSEETDCANSWRFTNGEPTQESSLYRTTRASRAPSSKGSLGKLIDVSKWDGKINWEKVRKSGIRYAIIRCGYGENKTSQDDKQFRNNVRNARAAGVKIGVYIYSYAYNTKKAQSEAEHVLRLLKSEGLTPSKLALPVYYDLEEQAGTRKPCVKSDGKLHEVNKAMLGKMATTFAKTITKAGYKVGVYANKNWWNTFLTDKAFSNKSWSKWVAQYSTSCTYKGSYDIWQYSSTGHVSGISTYVDMNYLYRNFDTKIATASIGMTGITCPYQVVRGTNDLSLGGKLTSPVTLKTVTVRILEGDSDAGAVKKSVTLYPGATTFDLASAGKLVEDLSFDGLPLGTYTYQVRAGVEDGQTTVFSKSFKVVEPRSDGKTFLLATSSNVESAYLDYTRPTFGTSGLTLSTGLTKGGTLPLKGGKVTSSVALTRVQATLTNLTTGKQVAQWSGKASAKSLALPAACISKLSTKSLPMGKYRLVVTASSSSATGTALSKTFTIGTAAPGVGKAKAAKKKFTAKWKKSSGATGYQVRYSRYKSMKSDYFKTTKSTSKTIKVKKKKTRYYYQVRSYKVIKGAKCYGSWSSVKSVKVK